MTKRILSFLLASLLVSSSVTTTSCDLQGKVDQLDKAARDIVQQALNALSDAVRQGTASVGNIEIILRDAIDKLGEGGDQFVRGQLQSLLARTLAAAGVEVRCGARFLADETLLSLARLIDILSGNTPREVTSAPVICNLDPVAIDLSLKQPTLEIYGYDIRPDNLQVDLVNTDGEIDVTKYLSVASGYQMALNLGINGVPISEKSQKIVFLWSGKELSSVPVIQVKTPACKTRTQLVVPNSATVKVSRNIGSGSSESFFVGASTRTSVQLISVGRNLYAVMAITAYRPKTLPLTFHSKMSAGIDISQIASAEEGWDITGIGFVNDTVSFDNITSTTGTYSLPGKDFVARDEITPDLGTKGVTSFSSKFVFNQLTLTLQEDGSDGHCIPTKPVTQGVIVMTAYPADILDDGRGFYGQMNLYEISAILGDDTKLESQVGAVAKAFPLVKDQSITIFAGSNLMLGKYLHPTSSWKNCKLQTGTPAPTTCILDAKIGQLNVVEANFILE